MSNKVIFLDIDGPMIPSTMYLINRMCSLDRIFPQTTIAVINRLCSDSCAKIVFNTTHNVPFDGVPDIEVAIVNHGLDANFIHKTDNKTKYPSLPRDLAIKEWLSRHDEVEAWVAIDDVKCADEPNMILINPDAGVHVGDMNKALIVLGGKQSLILI